MNHKRTITHPDDGRGFVSQTTIQASTDYAPRGFVDVTINGKAARLDRAGIAALAEVAALAVSTFDDPENWA